MRRRIFRDIGYGDPMIIILNRDSNAPMFLCFWLGCLHHLIGFWYSMFSSRAVYSSP